MARFVYVCYRNTFAVGGTPIIGVWHDLDDCKADLRRLTGGPLLFKVWRDGLRAKGLYIKKERIR